MIDKYRCMSRCELLPGQRKRCIRGRDHVETHLWVEALNRSDGRPMLAVWIADDADSPDLVCEVLVPPRRAGVAAQEDDEAPTRTRRVLVTGGQPGMTTADIYEVEYPDPPAGVAVQED